MLFVMANGTKKRSLTFPVELVPAFGFALLDIDSKWEKE